MKTEKTEKSEPAAGFSWSVINEKDAAASYLNVSVLAAGVAWAIEEYNSDPHRDPYDNRGGRWRQGDWAAGKGDQAEAGGCRRPVTPTGVDVRHLVLPRRQHLLPGR